MPRLLHVAGEVGPGLRQKRGGLDPGDFEGVKDLLRRGQRAEPHGLRGADEETFRFEPCPIQRRDALLPR